jgi:hypothetical protein
MGMTWEQSVKAIAAKLKESYAIAKSSDKGRFECCCCMQFLSMKMFSHVDGYIPRDPTMRKILEGKGTIASYVVCLECARLPEELMMLKVEKTLVSKGLLRDDLKPLDAPGGHSPGHQKHKHGPDCRHGQGGGQMLRNN